MLIFKYTSQTFSKPNLRHQKQLILSKVHRCWLAMPLGAGVTYNRERKWKSSPPCRTNMLEIISYFPALLKSHGVIGNVTTLYDLAKVCVWFNTTTKQSWYMLKNWSTERLVILSSGETAILLMRISKVCAHLGLYGLWILSVITQLSYGPETAWK